MTILETPAHHHGCPNCRFLGRDRARGPNEAGANAVDLYICINKRGEQTLLRRWSSVGEKYSSLDAEYADGARWDAVRHAAQRHGFKPASPRKYEIVIGSV